MHGKGLCDLPGPNGRHTTSTQGPGLFQRDIKLSAWIAERECRVTGGIVMMFAVHPGYQGKGVGSGLLQFAEDQAKEQSYTELRLATHAQLSENFALYSHLGWAEFNRDYIRIYMKKKTSSP